MNGFLDHRRRYCTKWVDVLPINRAQVGDMVCTKHLVKIRYDKLLGTYRIIDQLTVYKPHPHERVILARGIHYYE